MAETKLSLQVSGLDRALLKLGGARKNALPTSAVRALNKTGEKGRTQTWKEISEVDQLTLPQRAVVYKKELGGLVGPGQFRGNKATFKNLRSQITAFRFGMPMGIYLTKASKKADLDSAPETLITKRKQPVVWLGGVLRTLKSGILKGQTGVFIRNRRTGRFIHVFGPSVSQVLNRERDKIGKIVQPELQKEFDRQVDLEFRKIANK